MASFSCGNSSTSRAIRKGGKAVIRGSIAGSYQAALSSYLLSSPSSSSSERKYVSQMIDAVFEENIKALQKTLKKNVDVNLMIRFVEDGEKMTALHYTALKGKIEMLGVLLKSGLCNLDLTTPVDESTALHFACRFPSSSVSKQLVENLLSWGANINIVDHWEKSPLIWAAELGHSDVVQLLLKNGASLDHCYQIADAPESESSNHSPVSELCFNDPFYGNNAFIQACRYNHVQVIHLLLDYGPNLNAQNRNGSTALHVLCSGYLTEDNPNLPKTNLSSDIVEMLVGNGADVNIEDNLGLPPIIRTILCLERLIESGSPADQVLDIPHVIRVMQLLLKNGSDVRRCYPHLFPKKEITILKKVLLLYKDLLSIKPSDVLCHSLDKVVEILVFAGSPIDNEDIEIVLHFGRAHLVSCLTDHFQMPFSLRNCCVLQLRKQMVQPLVSNARLLSIPETLKKMICLEI